MKYWGRCNTIITLPDFTTKNTEGASILGVPHCLWFLYIRQGYISQRPKSGQGQACSIRKESARAREKQEGSCDETHLEILPGGRTERINRCSKWHGKKRFAVNHVI